MKLSANNLTLVRSGATVLRNVSASLNTGQITAIVGPNGAGKSSLLLALAGLLAPAGGGVDLDGTSLGAMAPKPRARALGFLPQGADIAWDVAVETLVALGRMPHGDARREPVEAAIQLLDLKSLRQRPVSQLSGGERARVLLARVLAGEPHWILADEPLAALDLAHQLNLVEHLSSCAKAGAGVVIVLHDLALAMNFADRVLVLDGGALYADAQPQDALTPETIAAVWGVTASWIKQGDPQGPGRQALISQSPDGRCNAHHGPK